MIEMAVEHRDYIRSLVAAMAGLLQLDHFRGINLLVLQNCIVAQMLAMPGPGLPASVTLSLAELGNTAPSVLEQKRARLFNHAQQLKTTMPQLKLSSSAQEYTAEECGSSCISADSSNKCEAVLAMRYGPATHHGSHACSRDVWPKRKQSS